MTTTTLKAPDQIALEITPSCKERGCSEPVRGSSITGQGHVCTRHNEIEWGRALLRKPEPYYKRMGLELLGVDA
jgi:hypothetical protein